MLYILTGALGFATLYFFDIANLKGRLFIKRACFISGHLALGYSILMVCIDSERFSMSPAARVTGYIISVLFFLVLIYSMFIEIPFKTTYMTQNRKSALVKTGTYGLVRHPAVLWYVLFLSGLFLMTGSKTLLFALPVWSAADVIYTILQERFIFIKMFGEEYRAYQKEVPNLIPTCKSIKKFLSTLKNSRPLSRG
jgi:protein-S-isoprenylcysteine O-methyltransferase Ste14